MRNYFGHAFVYFGKGPTSFWEYKSEESEVNQIKTFSNIDGS